MTPISISMAVTGLGLIAVGGWPNVTGGGRWLEAGILLYVVAVVYSMAIQAPAGRRLVELTSQPPAPGTPPAPELLAAARRVRQGGLVLGALVVVIVFLMVTKPF